MSASTFSPRISSRRRSPVDGARFRTLLRAGECCTLDKHFTAVDSLFSPTATAKRRPFRFAGPYTVSHHKSSLPIAGMFSFFNAGGGANQSNHPL